MHTIILGLGNELLGDEGVGVHAVRPLLQEQLPPETEALEVGTAVINCLPAFEKAERILVIDAMKAEGKPGTIYKISLEDCSGSPCIASMHGFNIFRVIALAGRDALPLITVFGVEPGLIDWSMSLSPQVTASMPHLLAALRWELTGRGEQITAH